MNEKYYFLVNAKFVILKNNSAFFKVSFYEFKLREMHEKNAVVTRNLLFKTEGNQANVCRFGSCRALQVLTSSQQPDKQKDGKSLKFHYLFIYE